MGYYLLLKICFSRLLWIINSSLENIFYDRIKVVFWTVCSTWVTAPLHCQRGFVQISKKYWKYKWWWKTSKLYISETKKKPHCNQCHTFYTFSKRKTKCFGPVSIFRLKGMLWRSHYGFALLPYYEDNCPQVKHKFIYILSVRLDLLIYETEPG